MVLLDAMTQWEPGRNLCKVKIRKTAAFVEDGKIMTPYLIEHMAQTVAACLGYEAFVGGHGVRVGMIIGCRNFEALEPCVRAGDTLTISASRIRGNDTLSHFDCHIHVDAVEVANATLTLFHAEQPPTD